MHYKGRCKRRKRGFYVLNNKMQTTSITENVKKNTNSKNTETADRTLIHPLICGEVINKVILSFWLPVPSFLGCLTFRQKDQ